MQYVENWLHELIVVFYILNPCFFAHLFVYLLDFGQYDISKHIELNNIAENYLYTTRHKN